MSNGPSSKEEIEARLRQTTRDEVILEEMIRLGFWPKQGTVPEDPADEIRRRAELQNELSELRKQTRHLHNEEALLKELRKKRFAESRKKRQETKERHERERAERAERWQERKQREVVFLGAGVSGGLSDAASDEARLAGYGLPSFATADEVAAAMGVTTGHLRFLAFARGTAETSHYVRFGIPKKTGGVRAISAPKPKLKAAQRWVLASVLDRVALDGASHGFRAGRSIVSNARPHVGAEVVVNFDLENFFPSISYRRVKGLFRSLGYSEAVATIFGLICTEPEVEEVDLDGRTYYVAIGERHLPQGAPSSPAITNVLCRRLDRRLGRMATEAGFAYSRYADDLTFSASGEALVRLSAVLDRARSIVAHEGFTVNEAKTRVLRRSRRQEVTGVVVNERPAVARETLKRFRATLYQIEKDGPVGKRWGHGDDVLASIHGFANFVAMVDPRKGAELQARVRSILDRHGWHERERPRAAAAAVESQAPPPPVDAPVDEVDEVDVSPEPPPIKKWWKMW